MAENAARQLMVDVVARVDKLERGMSKAAGITDRSMGKIEKRVSKMQRNIEGAMGRVSGSLAAGFAGAASIKGAQMLLDASTRITNALKVAGLEGAELTRVYDQLFKSAQNNAAPLEALVTLYGRAALVQKELNVSTAEMLRFTDNVAVALRVSGQSAQESSGALLQLSQALGAGTVRAEEFNSILEGALPIAQAAAAGLKEAGGSVAKLRQLVVDGKVSSEAFFRAFEVGADTLTSKVANAEMTTSQGFVRLQNVLIDTAGKVNEVTGASDAVGKALNTVSDIVEGLGGVIRKFADDDLSHLAQRIYEVLNPLGELIDKIGGIKNLPGVLSTINKAMFDVVQGKPINQPQRQQTTREILRENLGSAGKSGRVTSGSKPEMTPEQIGERIAVAFADKAKQVSLEDYKAPEKDKKPKTSGSKTHSKTTDQQIDDDVQAIRDRTAALQAELQMVGLSYQEQEKRRVSLDLEQAALAKLRDEAIKKGQTDLSNIKLSDDQRAKIDEVSAAYGRQADELRKVQEQHDAVTQASEEFYGAFKGGIMDAITGAASLSDALSDILNKLSQMLLNSAFDALFKPASGAGVSGGIFGAIGGLITGKYANGTNFAKGGLSLVGERGPELVNLPRGSQVIPNNKLANMSVPKAPTMPSLKAANNNSGGTVSAPVHITIDATGADAAGLARVQQQLAKLKSEIPAQVIQSVRKAQKSNVRF